MDSTSRPGVPANYRGMRRMWIDQPSTLQPHHRYHGRNVLAAPKNDDAAYVIIYLTQGPVVSFEVPESALSRGWIGEQAFDRAVASPTH